MPLDRQFGWAGPMPAKGYVGFVNIRVEDDGVLFAVRSEGSSGVSTYKIPLDVATVMLRDAYAATAVALGALEASRPADDGGEQRA